MHVKTGYMNRIQGGIRAGTKISPDSKSGHNLKNNLYKSGFSLIFGWII
jgi:hypothetical protein